jgi:hypothetical protein
VFTLLRKSVVPHLLPAAAGAAVLVALLEVAEGSIAGLFGTAVAGSVVYLGVYFATGATAGDRARLATYLRIFRSGQHAQTTPVTRRSAPVDGSSA